MACAHIRLQELMRNIAGKILLSASDLMRFMGCAHATTLDLAHLHGEGPDPHEDSEDATLLQKHGNAHEVAHLARLNLAGRGVVKIARGDLAENAETIRRSNASIKKRSYERSGALLAGLIYDDVGNRMTPVHVKKGGIRYRYYQSWVLAQGQKAKAGSVFRVPAGEIEQAVTEAMQKHLEIVTAATTDDGTVELVRDYTNGPIN